MGRVAFSEVLKWMAEGDIGPSEAARRFGVSSQRFNGWKVRGQVSADKSDEVASIIRRGLADEVSPLLRSDHHYIPLLDIRASMGYGAEAPDHLEVVRHIAVNLPDLRRVASFSNPTALSFITGYGNSMEPTFADGDVLLVDEGVQEIRFDAVYVLAKGNELFIKRIQRRPDGSWLMISDNKFYEPQVVGRGDMDNFRVRGRVVLAWNARKL